MRLTPSVAKFMGGKRYCKESELTLHTLLSHERSMGEISECVQLVRVTVATLDGKTTTHTLDSENHKVRDLKFRVEEEQGVEWHAQRFSYAPTAGEAAKVSGDFLPDGEVLKDGAAISLYAHKAQLERLRCRGAPVNFWKPPAQGRLLIPPRRPRTSVHVYCAVQCCSAEVVRVVVDHRAVLCVP